eukprot:TRINITY_DN3182_c0_g1_i1.p1 TRINITY_DN3182_c0_g1~~TRINITY_DN3182_c0_g1_i1.p1  ORF type:complete len:80 (-),score=12.84 TRINITY_DN3182_c0_g1_i1:109-348(-)
MDVSERLDLSLAEYRAKLERILLNFDEEVPFVDKRSEEGRDPPQPLGLDEVPDAVGFVSSPSDSFSGSPILFCDLVCLS